MLGRSLEVMEGKGNPSNGSQISSENGSKALGRRLPKKAVIDMVTMQL